MIRPLLILAALSAVVTLPGCDTDPPAAGAIETGAGPTTPGAVETSALPQEVEQAAPQDTRPNINEHATGRFTTSGMVGQVNGQAIYAHAIFDPIHEQLQQLAKQHPGMAFRRPAIEAISYRVREIVQNALVLGEAERDLGELEQQTLAYMVSEHREELLRRYGLGSPSLADQRIREDRGISLDQALEEYRQIVIVRRYLNNKLDPLVNVTRRDVERYYDEHRDKFNPQATRVIRLIRTHNPDDADAIALTLEQGGDFTELASTDVNRFKPTDGGRMEVVGKEALASSELNEAIAALEQGQYAGPIAVDRATWFVYLEAINSPEALSLKEAQLKIEQDLNNQQKRILHDRFMQRVLEEGSYTPLDEMIGRLYNMAEARYNNNAFIAQ